VFGGARRDEEKARAKERIFSFRDEFGQWDPRTSAPSCGTSTTAAPPGEHVRVFPLSNWTELDVWHYIARGASSCRRSTTRTSARCSSATACCYAATRVLAAARRRGRRRDGPLPHRRRHHLHRRVESTRTSAEVIAEVAATRLTERGATRADDRVSEAAMEDRKREGYF
jgi:sulfate adenylyltransferase subunit 2